MICDLILTFRDIKMKAVERDFVSQIGKLAYFLLKVRK